MRRPTRSATPPSTPAPDRPPREGRRRDAIRAAVVSAATSDLSGLLGLSPQLLPPADPPVIAYLVEWPWLRPLRVILRVTGRSIHEVVSSPAAAREVRMLWKLWKDSRRLAAENEARNTIREVLWWRSVGCPVPCPLCGSDERCDCAAESGFLENHHTKR